MGNILGSVPSTIRKKTIHKYEIDHPHINEKKSSDKATKKSSGERTTILATAEKQLDITCKI
jgi:hypothetical protein